jgi:hypothetical protein
VVVGGTPATVSVTAGVRLIWLGDPIGEAVLLKEVQAVRANRVKIAKIK